MCRSGLTPAAPEGNVPVVPARPMRHQARVLALVCAFSALVAFKPSDPFLVAFLRCIKPVSYTHLTLPTTPYV